MCSIIKESLYFGFAYQIINKQVDNFNMEKNTKKPEVNEGATIVTEENKELFVEGKAKIYTKYVQANQKGDMIENGVFYNPVQIFNRDFTLLVMQGYINRLKR